MIRTTIFRVSLEFFSSGSTFFTIVPTVFETLGSTGWSEVKPGTRLAYVRFLSDLCWLVMFTYLSLQEGKHLLVDKICITG
jgi:hypothetical protein